MWSTEELTERNAVGTVTPPKTVFAGRLLEPSLREIVRLHPALKAMPKYCVCVEPAGCHVSR